MAPTRGQERFCLHAQEKKKHYSGPRVPIPASAANRFIRSPNLLTIFAACVSIDFATPG